MDKDEYARMLFKGVSSLVKGIFSLVTGNKKVQRGSRRDLAEYRSLMGEFNIEKKEAFLDAAEQHMSREEVAEAAKEACKDGNMSYLAGLAEYNKHVH